MYYVLIVEDDPMVAMINEQYVCKNEQFTVVGSCRNGEDAIEFLKSNKVDLVVLDVFMPKMNGVETLKKIRELKISTDVIMVTAANDTTTLEETMNLGVIDYLIKPFAFERFQIALTKFESRITALKGTSTIDQSGIDSIMLHNQSAAQIEKNLPKGIQEATLTKIMDYFDRNGGWQSGDMISEKIGVSIVTVRHYMNYLVEQKIITESINYETGGRPCMLYKIR